MYVFPPDGGKPEKQAIPANVLERAQDMHNELVEAAAENDEELMELAMHPEQYRDFRSGAAKSKFLEDLAKRRTNSLFLSFRWSAY